MRVHELLLGNIYDVFGILRKIADISKTFAVERDLSKLFDALYHGMSPSS